MIEQSYLEIDESKYPIGDLIPESKTWLDLWHKHITRYQTRAKFWTSRLALGKKCSQFEGRNIFTPEQRAQYLRVEKKYPIEPQEMKPIIATLERMIEQAVPGSDITYEDESPAENSASPDTVKTVISYIKHKTGLLDKCKKVLHKGLVVGYPISVWAEPIRDMTTAHAGIPLRFNIPAWDSVLPNQYYTDETGLDIDDVIMVRKMEKKDLYHEFPDRKEEHKKYEAITSVDPTYQSNLLMENQTQTARDRANDIYEMVSQAKFDSSGGRYFVIQSIFPIVAKRRVWINEGTQAVFIVPENWSKEQQEEWLKMNPDFAVSDLLDCKTLWVTTISSDGFIWENRPHEYQENGELPCAWYIADTVDNIPTAIGEDLLPYIFMAAVCETEGLSQVRKGAGTTTYIKEGAVVNPESLNAELSAENGIVIISKDNELRDSVLTEQKTPNTTFIDYSDRVRNNMAKAHRVNEVAMGGTINRQSEAAQIEQTLAPQARYVDNYQAFRIQLENLICKLIPRYMTEQMVIVVKDEFGQKSKNQEITINETEYNAIDGEAKKIANDLVSARYRAEPVIGDDSLTSRDSQMKEFNEILQATGNQLFKLDPTMLGSFLNVFPNRFAREAAKYILESGKKMQESQAQSQKAEFDADMVKQTRREAIELAKMRTPKAAFKFSPEDVENAPDGVKVLYQMMEYFKQMNGPANAPAETPREVITEEQPEEIEQGTEQV
jgi:hypothetical protein